MTSSAVHPALNCDQLAPLLRANQSAWRQLCQKQRIGLFGPSACNKATAIGDVLLWLELDPLNLLRHRSPEKGARGGLLNRLVLVRLRERMNPTLRLAIIREGIRT